MAVVPRCFAKVEGAVGLVQDGGLMQRGQVSSRSVESGFRLLFKMSQLLQDFKKVSGLKN